MNKRRVFTYKEKSNEPVIVSGTRNLAVERFWDPSSKSGKRGQLWERIMDRARAQFRSDGASWRPPLVSLASGSLQSGLAACVCAGMIRPMAIPVGLGFMAARSIEDMWRYSRGPVALKK